MKARSLGLVLLLAGSPGELVTGTSNMNLRNVKHGSFKVLGDTPLKLFTAHIVDKGKPLYDCSK